jgi:hypothetical protein
VSLFWTIFSLNLKPFIGWWGRAAPRPFHTAQRLFIEDGCQVIQKVNPLREQKNRFALLQGRAAARPYHRGLRIGRMDLKMPVFVCPSSNIVLKRT